MFVISYDPWAKHGFQRTYADCQEYLAEYGKEHLVSYINKYLDEHRPELPKFELTDEFKKYCEQYIKKNAERKYVINSDGSYDYIRLNNLIIDAVADFYHI
mgnify:CR=1 FL=1